MIKEGLRVPMIRLLTTIAVAVFVGAPSASWWLILAGAIRRQTWKP